jgi:hypothetical protein
MCPLFRRHHQNFLIQKKLPHFTFKAKEQPTIVSLL